MGTGNDAELKAAAPQNPSPQSKTSRAFGPAPRAAAPWTAVTKPAESPLFFPVKISWQWFLLASLALQAAVPGLLFASAAYFQKVAFPVAESCSTPMPPEPPASPQTWQGSERGPVPGL